MDKKTMQARIRMIKALNIAISEAKKLNKIADDMHEMLLANETKKAA